MTNKKVRKSLKKLDYNRRIWYFEINKIYNTREKGEKLC